MRQLWKENDEGRKDNYSWHIGEEEEEEETASFHASRVIGGKNEGGRRKFSSFFWSVSAPRRPTSSLSSGASRERLRLAGRIWAPGEKQDCPLHKVASGARGLFFSLSGLRRSRQLRLALGLQS